MPLKFDIYHKEVVLSEPAYTTVALLVSGDTTAELNAVSSVLLPASIFQATSGTFLPYTIYQNTSGTFLQTSIYQDASGTFAPSNLYQNLSANWQTAYSQASTIGNYLPLSGGAIVGNLTITGNITGTNTTVSFNAASAIGFRSFATNTGLATASNSFAEGNNTRALGSASHAEGLNTTAAALGSHAEGNDSIASGNYAHAQGSNTEALGLISHAMGSRTKAVGDYTFAGGRRAVAKDNYSYVWATEQSPATSEISSTRVAQYLISASGGVFIPGKVGIGTDSIDNALTVAGNVSATGVVYASGGNSEQWNASTTTIQSNSANWNSTSNFVQTNSAIFVPAQTNFTIETNALSTVDAIFERGFILKREPVPVYMTREFDGTMTELTGTGNCFRGSINFNQASYTTSQPFYNNYFHYNFNNLNYLLGSQTFNNIVLLSSLNFPHLKGISDNININFVINLQQISYPELEYIGGSLNVGSQTTGAIDNLNEVNFPKLQFVESSLVIGGYGSTKNPVLSSISFPRLKKCADLRLGTPSAGTFRSYPNVTNINLSSLKDCDLINFQNLPNLKQMTFNSLKVVRGNTTFPDCSSLTNLNFPELEIIGGYMSALVNTNSLSLTSISMPKIKVAYSSAAVFEYSTAANLSVLEFGTDTLENFNRASFICSQRLLQSSVDNILKAFARLDGTQGTVLWSGSDKTLTLGGNNQAPSYTGGVTTTSAGTNFVRTGSTVVASVTSHGHTTGDIVTFIGNGASALNGTYSVTATNIDEFQYTTPTSGSLTGSATVSAYRTTVSTDGFRYFQNIALRGATVTIRYPV